MMGYLDILSPKSLTKVCRLGVFFVVLCGICLMGESSWAETAYVKDTISITFRTGPSTKHEVIANLSSGQAVEVLGVEGDWSHVQLMKDGAATKEGWVLTRYLITRRPWEMQAQAAFRESAEFKKKAADLEKELSDAVRRGKELDRALRDTAGTLEDLKEEHESLKKGAAGYLALKTTHEATQSELESTQLELGELTEKYEDLKSSESWKWFGTGAGVFLLALLIGIGLGRQQKKRRPSYF